MKKVFIILLFLIATVFSPVSAEKSYGEFVEYTYTWLGQDPDSLWRMRRNDVKERLSSQNAFTCKDLFDAARGKSCYLCKSANRFSGKYRMRFYFSNSGLLEAVEFRAEDDHMQELAECYAGQIPTIQTMWKDLTGRYGDNGRHYTVSNGIFTDYQGMISAQAGIGSNTYVVIGQSVRKYSFDRYSLMYVFCSNSYAAVHATDRY